MAGQGASGADNVTRAKFRVVTQNGNGKAIEVHFNPESLEYTLTNNLSRRGDSDRNKQYVSQSSGKLSMELVFDTTDTGQDVRSLTIQFRKMMKPEPERNDSVGQVVQFEWGTYRFKGVFENLRETLDYFSPKGVPLRAALHVSMAQQDGLFAENERTARAARSKNDQLELSPSEAQQMSRDPDMRKALAQQNGSDSLRDLSGFLTFNKEIKLGGPVGFTGVGGGLSLGLSVGLGGAGGAGLGLNFGAGPGGGFGLTFGAGPGFGLPSINVRANLPGFNVGPSGQNAARPGTSAGRGTTAAPGTPQVGTAFPPTRASAAGVGAGQAQRAPFGASTNLLTPVNAEGAALFAEAPSNTSVSAVNPNTRARVPVEGPRWGGRSSAGVPAVFGAFSGLRSAPAPRRVTPFVREQTGLPGDANLRSDASTAFELGGRAVSLAAAGLSADVGQNATLRDRISFEED